ncbi:MAG: FtsW/RodA/SpoVE family cell cycle protein [Anaerolineales bacterium]|jgi:cell division protein FtsW
MGEHTFVSRKSNSDAIRRRRVALDIDVPLLLTVITLLVFGLIMVFSSSWDVSLVLYGSATSMAVRQLGFVLLGIIAAGALTFMNYKWLGPLAIPIMLGTILLLVLVLFIGETRLNATRTLFGGSVQPSELAKLATVIYLAVWLNNKRDTLDSWGFGLLPLAAILGIVGFLIFLQPDLSATMTVVILGGLMFFLAGGDMRRIALLLVSTVAIGGLLVMVSPTGQNRLQSYVVGLEDPLQASYHVQRSLEAFVNGGVFGVGIGNADTKLTGLPVPPTDSIFAVIGEETGVIGAAVLIGLFIILLWRSMVIANKAPDEFGKLLASGLGIWLAMEALINMAVIVGLLPFAGNALPFISYGGSNMVVTMISVGILMSISRSGEMEQYRKDTLANAFAHLRRRNRRGSVSRPRRSSGAERS